MMDQRRSFGDNYLDEYLAMRIRYERWLVGKSRKMIRILEQVYRELRAKIDQFDFADSGPRAEVLQLAKLRREEQALRKTIERHFLALRGEITGDFKSVRDLVSKETAEMINHALGAEVLTTQIEKKARSVIAIYSSDAASNILINNVSFESHFTSLIEKTSVSVIRTMNTAILGNWSRSQARKTVRELFAGEGNASPGYVIRRLTRDYYNTIFTESQMAAYHANDDVIEGVEWHAALDMSTCLVCGPLDGLAWQLRTREPIGHNERFRRPPGGAHPDCRCGLIPVLKSASEMPQKRLALIPEAVRAAMDGPTTVRDWLKWLPTLPSWKQKEVLGPGMFNVWKKHGVDLRYLLKHAGDPPTLREISAHFNAA